MGSGCIQNSKKVTDKCGIIYPSDCVQYQGPPVPLLGICTGDSITEVEQAIINKLLEVLSGTGITLDQVSLENCVYLKDLFGSQDKTLVNLINLLIQSDCNLKALIDELFVRTQPSNFIFDLKCLPVITNPTTEKIIQSIITELCSLKATVDSLVSNSGNTTIIDSRINTALNGLITSSGNKGITKTVNSSGLTHYHFTSLVPPLGAIMYFGPLNNFDPQGKGVVGTAYEGWHLCNGNGGTIDLRGFVPVGCVQGVPGAALDPLVDPNANNDASMNYSLGSKGGLAKVSLTSDNNGPHTHQVVDNGHYHNYDYPNPEKFSGSKFDAANANSTSSRQTTLSYSNITIGQSGQGVAHENRMPYKAVNWIVKID